MTATEFPEARKLLVRHLESRPLAQNSRILVASMPAPAIPATAAMRLADGEREAFCWIPPEGPTMIAGGAAATVEGAGVDRMAQLDTAAAVLFTKIQPLRLSDSRDGRPRLFGGLSFAAGDQGQIWQGFGEGRFVLPRWWYELQDGQASLNLSIRPDGDGRNAALKDLGRLWSLLTVPSQPLAAKDEIADGLRAEHLDPMAWNRYIREVRSEILGGRFEKLVAARSSSVAWDRPFDDLKILANLAERYPGCHLILCRHGGATFLGAPPETLFEKKGTDLRTHALAGSVRLRPDFTAEQAGRALMRSRKNREEHAVVLDEILSLLGPLVESIEYAETPRVMQLRNLLHLESPIRARLPQGVHAFQLLEALHPTPAVAGWPRDAAITWIREREPPRGWYAAPVGWFNAEGNGVFSVAIRTALIRGREARVFAGAGIMHDSDPPMEYTETAAKLQAMLSALGIDAA